VARSVCIECSIVCSVEQAASLLTGRTSPCTSLPQFRHSRAVLSFPRSDCVAGQVDCVPLGAEVSRLSSLRRLFRKGRGVWAQTPLREPGVRFPPGPHSREVVAKQRTPDPSSGSSRTVARARHTSELAYARQGVHEDIFSLPGNRCFSKQVASGNASQVPRRVRQHSGRASPIDQTCAGRAAGRCRAGSLRRVRAGDLCSARSPTGSTMRCRMPGWRSPSRSRGASSTSRRVSTCSPRRMPWMPR